MAVQGVDDPTGAGRGSWLLRRLADEGDDLAPARASTYTSVGITESVGDIVLAGPLMAWLAAALGGGEAQGRGAGR